MQSLRALFIAFLVLSWIVVAASQAPKVQTTTAPQTSPTSGKEMYEAYCASCHGKDGTGNGPAAPAMKVSPTDLTTLAKNNEGKFPHGMVEQSIRGEDKIPAHGSHEMPVWGPVLWSVSSHDQSQMALRISNLSKYIESLQQK